MVKSNSYKFKTKEVSVFYGPKQAINGISLNIEEKKITALIGPSGCGKSTYLRCLNRMNDVISNCSIKGKVLLDGQNIYSDEIDPVQLRAKVGMVFQKPNPFPKSIFENIAYGPRIHGIGNTRGELNDLVHHSLERAGLIDEVKDRLDDIATGLSGGQQQRICIARAIAVDPEVILMDEPCSSLDPIATAKIEELMNNLASSYTIIIVTHSMQQAARVSQKTAYFHLGKLVEYGDTKEIFTRPQNEQTEAYISGKIG